jgi:hypothetical protein
MDGMAFVGIAYTRLAPVSIHGSSKRFRELVTYSQRTPITSVPRVRKSYQESEFRIPPFSLFYNASLVYSDP